ncbi:hypothetical protein CONLIGDRAFT_15128 [Coniochaeta ligniaria NRRL 30616]|uniref:Uncharacterized protein n=1 Tax=Coniochaeta ligniaria NRRL 30616 TaxID=1408157 RepID=A0A1J7JZ30_9PEZI|nr:hypothetical protein CONLIGDRAFT_15128 [Coniochaeta ligniaria NRRL 30616]
MFDKERRGKQEALEQKWAREAKKEELEREWAREAELRRKRKAEGQPYTLIHHPCRKRARQDTEDDNVEKKEDGATASLSTNESSEVPTAHQELLAGFAEMQQVMDEKRRANRAAIGARVSDPEYDSDSSLEPLMPVYEPPTPAYNYPHDKGAMERWNPDWMRVLHGLLISCRQVREEALGVVYGENVFRVRQLEGEQRFLWEFMPEERRLRIRHIMIELRSDHRTSPDGPQRPDLLPNPWLWEPMIPNLVSIRILAQQPTKTETSFVDRSLLLRDHSEDCCIGVASAIALWLHMIKPTLEYFGSRILPSTMVMVDDNGSKEVGVLLERLLPSFRRIRTEEGEYTFKRDPQYDIHYGGYAGSHSGSTPPPPQCVCNENEGLAWYEHWRDQLIPL